MRTIARVGAWLVAIALLAMPNILRAQTCTFVMSNVDFGSVDVMVQGPIDLTAQATFNCSGAATPYIHACASLGVRSMTGPDGAKLAYEMYIDVARTRPWGSLWDASAANVLTAEIPIVSGSGYASVPVYVRIFDAQGQLPVGAYTQGFLGAGYTGYNVVGYTTTPPACTTSSGPQNPFSFTTRATVVPGCSVSATNIDFGQMGIVGQPVNATGVITTTCTKSASYSLSLDKGRGPGATFASRAMSRSGGSEVLNYTLYRDAARTQPWGDGNSGSSNVSATGTGGTQTATVYGTIPAQATPRPGSYADTIVVTVTF